MYEKPALPLNLAPQLVGAEVAHVRKGFDRSGVVATSSSPTPMPTAEGLETQGGFSRLWDSSPRPPALHLSTAYSR